MATDVFLEGVISLRMRDLATQELEKDLLAIAQQIKAFNVDQKTRVALGIGKKTGENIEAVVAQINKLTSAFVDMKAKAGTTITDLNNVFRSFSQSIAEADANLNKIKSVTGKTSISKQALNAQGEWAQAYAEVNMIHEKMKAKLQSGIDAHSLDDLQNDAVQAGLVIEKTLLKLQKLQTMATKRAGQAEKLGRVGEKTVDTDINNQIKAIQHKLTLIQKTKDEILKTSVTRKKALQDIFNEQKALALLLVKLQKANQLTQERELKIKSVALALQLESKAIQKAHEDLSRTNQKFDALKVKAMELLDGIKSQGTAFSRNKDEIQRNLDKLKEMKGLLSDQKTVGMSSAQSKEYDKLIQKINNASLLEKKRLVDADAIALKKQKEAELTALATTFAKEGISVEKEKAFIAFNKLSVEEKQKVLLQAQNIIKRDSLNFDKEKLMNLHKQEEVRQGIVATFKDELKQLPTMIARQAVYALIWTTMYGTIRSINNAIREGIKLYSDLEKGLGRSLATGLSAEQVQLAFTSTSKDKRGLEEYVNQVRQVAGLQALLFTSKHTATVEDYTMAIYELTSANIAMSDALKYADTVIKLNISAQGDIESTTRSLAGVFNIFKDVMDDTLTDQEKFEQIGQTVLYVWAKEQVELEELNNAMKYAGNIARTTNLDYRVLIATIGHLNTQMIKGSTAGTGFRQLQNSMAKNLSDLPDLFRETNQTLIDFSETQNMAYDPAKPLDFIGILRNMRDQLIANRGEAVDMGQALVFTADELNDAMRKIGLRGSNVLLTLINTFPELEAKIRAVVNLQEDYIDQYVRLREQNIVSQFEILKKNLISLPGAFILGLEKQKDMAKALEVINDKMEILISTSFALGATFGGMWEAVATKIEEINFTEVNESYRNVVETISSVVEVITVLLMTIDYLANKAPGISDLAFVINQSMKFTFALLRFLIEGLNGSDEALTNFSNSMGRMNGDIIKWGESWINWIIGIINYIGQLKIELLDLESWIRNSSNKDVQAWADWFFPKDTGLIQHIKDIQAQSSLTVDQIVSDVSKMRQVLFGERVERSGGAGLDLDIGSKKFAENVMAEIDYIRQNNVALLENMNIRRALNETLVLYDNLMSGIYGAGSEEILTATQKQTEATMTWAMVMRDALHSMEQQFNSAEESLKSISAPGGGIADSFSAGVLDDFFENIKQKAKETRKLLSDKVDSTELAQYRQNVIDLAESESRRNVILDKSATLSTRFAVTLDELAKAGDLKGFNKMNETFQAIEEELTQLENDFAKLDKTPFENLTPAMKQQKMEIARELENLKAIFDIEFKLAIPNIDKFSKELKDKIAGASDEIKETFKALQTEDRIAVIEKELNDYNVLAQKELEIRARIEQLKAKAKAGTLTSEEGYELKGISQAHSSILDEMATDWKELEAQAISSFGASFAELGIAWNDHKGALDQLKLKYAEAMKYIEDRSKRVRQNILAEFDFPGLLPEDKEYQKMLNEQENAMERAKAQVESTVNDINQIQAQLALPHSQEDADLLQKLLSETQINLATFEKMVTNLSEEQARERAVFRINQKKEEMDREFALERENMTDIQKARYDAQFKYSELYAERISRGESVRDIEIQREKDLAEEIFDIQSDLTDDLIELEQDLLSARQRRAQKELELTQAQANLQIDMLKAQKAQEILLTIPPGEERDQALAKLDVAGDALGIEATAETALQAQLQAKERGNALEGEILATQEKLNKANKSLENAMEDGNSRQIEKYDRMVKELTAKLDNLRADLDQSKLDAVYAQSDYYQALFDMATLSSGLDPATEEGYFAEILAKRGVKSVKALTDDPTLKAQSQEAREIIQGYLDAGFSVTSPEVMTYITLVGDVESGMTSLNNTAMDLRNTLQQTFDPANVDAYTNALKNVSSGGAEFILSSPDAIETLGQPPSTGTPAIQQYAPQSGGSKGILQEGNKNQESYLTEDGLLYSPQTGLYYAKNKYGEWESISRFESGYMTKEMLDDQKSQEKMNEKKGYTPQEGKDYLIPGTIPGGVEMKKVTPQNYSQRGMGDPNADISNISFGGELNKTQEAMTSIFSTGANILDLEKDMNNERAMGVSLLGDLAKQEEDIYSRRDISEAQLQNAYKNRLNEIGEERRQREELLSTQQSFGEDLNLGNFGGLNNAGGYVQTLAKATQDGLQAVARGQVRSLNPELGGEGISEDPKLKAIINALDSRAGGDKVINIQVGGEDTGKRVDAPDYAIASIEHGIDEVIASAGAQGIYV